MARRAATMQGATRQGRYVALELTKLGQLVSLVALASARDDVALGQSPGCRMSPIGARDRIDGELCGKVHVPLGEDDSAAPHR